MAISPCASRFKKKGNWCFSSNEKKKKENKRIEKEYTTSADGIRTKSAQNPDGKNILDCVFFFLKKTPSTVGRFP